MFEKLIFYFDLIGTVIFAVTGAVSAVKLKLDMLGVAVFACTVGVGGGMLRDAIIGAVPVAALQNEIYLIACILTGLLIFFISPALAHHKEIIMFCDAFGLGVFTAIGVAKGAQFGLGPTGIILCGTLSAVGGGILRDVMARKIPSVLICDFYATASLLGGVLYLLLRHTELPIFYQFAAVSLAVIIIRLLAIHFRVQLPKAGRKSKAPLV